MLPIKKSDLVDPDKSLLSRFRSHKTSNIDLELDGSLF